jgi:hypothetical protein
MESRDETEYRAGRTNSDSVRSSGDPDDHPLVPQLNELFGDHTFFLDRNGLNVVEPNNSMEAGPPAGTVVNVANWSDAKMTGLTPHEPEPTEVVVILESKH